ncbi:MAG: sulfopyruvate decarboxylase subunit beta [Methanobacteriaceae archaeon]|jgi:sulfopyruvate decarboxylase subunit beta|nr:sulfopyruvate decarboxylase subunit beta [Candidatus Methanorudis spinitermitis]
MERFDGIKNVMKHIEDEIIVCNIGFPSRELYEIKDRSKNFYMLGSMGLASSIGLGLAMSKIKEKVIIFDGDGSILMNLGSLITVFNQNPSNFILIIFDNGCYGSTGNQCTYAQNVNLLEVAKSIGFKNSYDYNEIDFKDILKSKQEGPIFIHYKILPGNADSPIIDISPEEIKNRFMKSIK